MNLNNNMIYLDEKPPENDNQVVALMPRFDLDNRQPDSPIEYFLTRQVGNYLADENGNIICYGNMVETYRLLGRIGINQPILSDVSESEDDDDVVSSENNDVVSESEDDATSSSSDNDVVPESKDNDVMPDLEDNDVVSESEDNDVMPDLEDSVEDSDEVPDLVPSDDRGPNYIPFGRGILPLRFWFGGLGQMNSHLIPNSSGPFTFDRSVSLNIKPDPTYEELFNILHEHPFTYINFQIISATNMSFGNGASRQIYQYVWTDIMNKLLRIICGYFLDISTDNLVFWNYEDNIELFVSFIGLCVTSDCVLPYHLHPILLQKIVQKPMTLEQQLYFLKYYNPDLYMEIIKYTSDDTFDVIKTTGYDTIEEYIEADIFRNQMENWKLDMYQKIADLFIKKFDSICNYDCIKLDTIISGYYEIKASDVIAIMPVDNPICQNMWTQFIESMTSDQLKKLLLLCSNSLSTVSKFQINILDSMETDIKISTCFRQVDLNKKLFETTETLDSLKLYLDDVDQTIVDIHNRNPEQNNNPERNNIRPARGRFLDQGLRLGEMERDAVTNYGINTLLLADTARSILSDRPRPTTIYTTSNNRQAIGIYESINREGSQLYGNRTMMTATDISDRSSLIMNMMSCIGLIRRNTDRQIDPHPSPTIQINNRFIHINGLPFRIIIYPRINIGRLVQNNQTNNRLMFYHNHSDQISNPNPIEKFIVRLMAYFSINCIPTDMLSELIRRFFIRS